MARWVAKKQRQGYRHIRPSAGNASDSPANLSAVADKLEFALCCQGKLDAGAFAAGVARFASTARSKRPQRPRSHPPAQAKIIWPLDDATYRAQAELAAVMRAAAQDDALTETLRVCGVDRVHMAGGESAAAVAACQAVRLITRASLPALSRGVVNALVGDPALRQFSLRLYREGTLYLGQLAQMSFGEVLEIADFNRARVARLEARLAGFNLQLGGRAPQWRIPEMAGFAKARRQASRTAQACDVVYPLR